MATQMFVDVTYRTPDGWVCTDAMRSVESFREFRPECTVLSVSDPFELDPNSMAGARYTAPYRDEKAGA